MPYFTAQIETATNFVKAVTETANPLGTPPAGIYYVTLSEYRQDYAGCTYSPENKTFTPAEE